MISTAASAADGIVASAIAIDAVVVADSHRTTDSSTTSIRSIRVSIRISTDSSSNSVLAADDAADAIVAAAVADSRRRRCHAGRSVR